MKSFSFTLPSVLVAFCLLFLANVHASPAPEPAAVTDVENNADNEMVKRAPEPNRGFPPMMGKPGMMGMGMRPPMMMGKPMGMRRRDAGEESGVNGDVEAFVKRSPEPVPEPSPEPGKWGKGFRKFRGRGRKFRPFK